MRCALRFSRVYFLSSLLCVPVRWSFQEEASEMQSHTRLVCRAERVHFRTVRAGPAFFLFLHLSFSGMCEDQKKTKFSSVRVSHFFLFLLRRRRVFRVPFDYLSNSLFVPGLEYISAVFMNFSSVHYARDASRVCVGEEEFFFLLLSFLFLRFVFAVRLGKIATWLILPVVICLSQRLSHACLSMNIYTVKLRMAH